MAQNKPASALLILGFVLVLVSGMAAVFAGFGTRWGWWNFRTGFTILRWAAYGGLAAAGVCIPALGFSLQAGRHGNAALAVIGMLISLAIAGIPWNWAQTAKRLPPIHDISTDTNNPPRFVVLLPLRAGAPNPADYGGPEIAAQQRGAYPEVKTLRLNLPAAAAFDKALDTGRRRGWMIVDANKNEGRIEACDKTFWFGFLDDIVIRIAQDGPGSVVDVRSVSRVGKSDIGTNAKRIFSFLRMMQD